MAKINNNVTSLVITLDDVTKEVRLPNTASNIAWELVKEKFDDQTISEIVQNESYHGISSERLVAYRAWFKACNDAVKDLDMAALNAAAAAQIEADRIEAERIAEEERQAEEAQRAEEEQRLAPIRNFEAAKQAKLAALEAYDLSSNVNSYSIGGIQDWKTPAERTQLATTVNAEKANGNEETVLWLGLTPLTLNCDLVLSMLIQLEVYAHECFNVTAQHKANITAIAPVGEDADYVALKAQVEAYDFTVGYPPKLAF